MKYIVHILLLNLLLACSKNDIVHQSVETSAFHSIELNSSIELVLVPDLGNTMEITGHKRMTDKLVWVVEDSVLKIKCKAPMAWTHPKHRSIVLRIGVNELRMIRANESCSIRNEDTLKGADLGIVMASKLNSANLVLDYKTVYFWNNFPCGGKVNLTGKCEVLKLWVYALMQVDASKLSCQTALIENYSKGNCSILAKQKIAYSIFGSGNIVCAGQPSIIEANHMEGSGKLVLIP